MSTPLIAWTIYCLAIGLLWLSRHRQLSRAEHESCRLTPANHPAPAKTPRLSVLVAAKDEEANIGMCVASLLDQDYPDFEVVAIDDRSTDRTGAILDRLASENGDRLRVIHVENVRDGWFGKNNAMREGVDLASGEWFCFVDADCRQTSRRTLSVAMAEVQERGVDFLSLLPVLETKSFWERLLQPVCAAILMIWFRPERVNHPKSSAAYANGAFMLMSRETYEAIGGHEAVKSQLNEDIHMARLCKHVGRRLFVVENDGLYVTRMYASFAETFRGWSRIFFGCFGKLRRLTLTAFMMLLASILPFLGLVVSAAGLLLSGGEAAHQWKAALVLSVVVVIALESVIYRFNRLSRGVSWAWITYPLGISVALAMLLNAMGKRLGAPTTWRGTTYRGEAQVGNATPPDTDPPATVTPITDANREPATDVVA